MSELFVEDDDLEEEGFHEDKVNLNLSEVTTVDARRRLEKILDDKMLQRELDDYLED